MYFVHRFFNMQRVHSRRSEGSEAEVDGLGNKLLQSLTIFFNMHLNGHSSAGYTCTHHFFQLKWSKSFGAFLCGLDSKCFISSYCTILQKHVVGVMIYQFILRFFRLTLSGVPHNGYTWAVVHHCLWYCILVIPIQGILMGNSLQYCNLNLGKC